MLLCHFFVIFWFWSHCFRILSVQGHIRGFIFCLIIIIATLLFGYYLVIICHISLIFICLFSYLFLKFTLNYPYLMLLGIIFLYSELNFPCRSLNTLLALIQLQISLLMQVFPHLPIQVTHLSPPAPLPLNPLM